MHKLQVSSLSSFYLLSFNSAYGINVLACFKILSNFFSYLFCILDHLYEVSHNSKTIMEIIHIFSSRYPAPYLHLNLQSIFRYAMWSSDYILYIFQMASWLSIALLKWPLIAQSEILVLSYIKFPHVGRSLSGHPILCIFLSFQ